MKLTGFFLWILIGVLFGFEQGQGSPSVKSDPQRKSSHLELSSSYQQSSDPLTTDLLGKIDPAHKNPHLERWGLRRDQELKGFQVIEYPQGTYGVEAQALISRTLGYLRPQGPWYQALSQFPCTPEVNSGFATQEGAAQAALYAAESWSQLLSQELETLSSLFSKVRVQNFSTAQIRGEMIFQSWIERLENRWRAQVFERARKEEWRFYLKTAREAGICPRTTPSGAQNVPSLKSQMEPLSGSPPQPNQLLARAPARLWNGLFSVRVNVTLGERKLNGRFLIDSTAPRSIISPVWLEAQGIYPSWILIPDTLPERVIWSGLWNEQRPLSRLVKVDQVELSGLKIPIQKFLLAETEFFAPPENLGSCCDGVLGVDFLRLYPMEFQSKAPAEVRIWPREGFLWSGDTPWLEMSESEDGTLVSACEWRSSSEKKPKASPVRGVRWDTAQEEATQVHLPWQSWVRSQGKARSLSLTCDSIALAHELQPELSEAPSGMAPLGPLAESDPAVSVGMALLGQSSFTLDLPHGRIWFKSGKLPLHAPQKNQSGLVVQFEQNNGERTLKVEHIKPRSPASQLSKKGLQKGSLLLELNSVAVDELDLWQVEQILSGAQGKKIPLKWKHKKVTQEGFLQLL